MVVYDLQKHNLSHLWETSYNDLQSRLQSRDISTFLLNENKSQYNSLHNSLQSSLHCIILIILIIVIYKIETSFAF